EDCLGVIKTIEADACVVASPKYVAKLIVPAIPPEQIKLMDAISYRGYVVGNAIFNKPVISPGFDIYCFEGSRPEMPSAMQPSKRPFSDVCFGSWAQDDKTEHGILTVYRAIPTDGGRQFLFSPLAHSKHLKVIDDELKEFTKEMGIDYGSLKGIRMTRWGHSIPVARKGLIQSGHLEKMNRSVGGKIFFANQDNWANPAFECSFAAAKEAALLVKEILG
ncbi:MAG: FAD-dependent oxidoreductase, partial [Bdellovibrionales bacterium]|nr:FAD-dependent oxidoreductase [Bdellovibrionales bacterium]